MPEHLWSRLRLFPRHPHSSGVVALHFDYKTSPVGGLIDCEPCCPRRQSALPQLRHFSPNTSPPPQAPGASSRSTLRGSQTIVGRALALPPTPPLAPVSGTLPLSCQSATCALLFRHRRTGILNLLVFLGAIRRSPRSSHPQRKMEMTLPLSAHDITLSPCIYASSWTLPSYLAVGPALIESYRPAFTSHSIVLRLHYG